ncbi:MAG: inorganic diphosphatase [Candidatus Acidiferrales bacterium]
MKVFIQNEAGSKVKHRHDEKTLELKGTVEVSRAYPFAYGFILGTTAEDGMNVDCFVLTKSRLRTGDIVECEAVGLMQQIEDGKEDHNVLAAMSEEEARVDEDIRRALIEFVTHVFDHVAGKRIGAGEFRGRDAALRHIAKHLDAAARG